MGTATFAPFDVVEIVSPSSRTRDYRRKRDETCVNELVWRPARQLAHGATLRIDIKALFAGLPQVRS